MKKRRTTRILDIAQAAGVGTATVDRVLNQRGSVADATAERVRSAMDMLATRSSGSRRYSPGTRHEFEVVLPAGAGPSTDHLGAALRRAGEYRGVSVTSSFVEKMNPAALAERLLALKGTGKSAVAFQALDHPQVRDAIARLAEDGTPALALMSDLDGSELIGFVGADNRAAGRTAGFLMGRFVRSPGKVAVLWGGQLYRSHEQREIGFRTVVRSDFPHLKVLDLVAGRDDSDGNYREVLSVLKEHDDLVGIYSVGGGNRGVVRALEECQRAGDLILIGHNLTATTQQYLLDGSMDAVIHQNMDRAAGITIDALINHCIGRRQNIERLPVEVIVRENIPNIARSPSAD